MTHQVYLSSPAQKGTYGVKMVVNDLMPGSTNDLKLTQQLNTLEANVQSNKEALNSFGKINVDGVSVDITQATAQNSAEIAALDQQLNNYQSFEYDYDQNGVPTTETVPIALTGLYSVIKTIQDQLDIQTAQIETLEAEIEALKA